MNINGSDKRFPGSWMAFIILCTIWFLEQTGLLNLLF